MANSASKFLVVGTPDTHVRDQVRDLSHLETLLVRSHHLHSGIVWIAILRTEVLEALQRRLGSDLPRIIGDYQNRVAIKVRSRQTLSDLAIDTNSIARITKQLSCFGILVANNQLGNLERSSMGETN